jgi:feruloyl esterase
VIGAEILRQCDGQDGLLDQIISDPFGCHVNLNTLLCNTMNKKTKNCLTPDQLDTLSQLYSDYVDTNQTYVFPRMAYGSELEWDVLVGQNQPSGLGIDFVRYFLLNDPNWEYKNFDYSIVQLTDRLRPGDANADNFNLRPFFSKGGKIIHYHGLADAWIPPGRSQYLYDHVYRNISDMDLNQYYRYFHVLGMGHWEPSAHAPHIIGGNGQDTILGSQYFGVPGFNDSQHDALLALVDWVENGKAPDQIIATKYVNDEPAQGVLRQRPICPYPKKARYLGARSTDDPASFYCVT